MKSPKETALEEKILHQLAGYAFPEDLARVLFLDEETQHIQEYANVVSLRRLGFNDHGPVHMRQVAYNAIKALVILHGAGVKTTLEEDGAGRFEDSHASVLLSGFLHDLGMSVGRECHERTSAMLALPIIDRVLLTLLPDDKQRRVVIRSMALEGILGHMGTTRIHSLEAGLILTEQTFVNTKDGQRWNGNLRYMILPISQAVELYYERQLANLKTDTRKKRKRKRRQIPHAEYVASHAVHEPEELPF